jgi:hypothetical protein
MLFETYFQMEGEDIIELELSIDELVDATLGINHAQGFDLNVDVHSVDVDDVAPPTIKLSDVFHILTNTKFVHITSTYYHS